MGGGGGVSVGRWGAYVICGFCVVCVVRGVCVVSVFAEV